MKHRIRIVAIVLVLSAGSGTINAQDAVPRFEVASVKLNKAPRSLDNFALNYSPGRFVAIGVPLPLLVSVALDLRDIRLETEHLPEWIATERYDIVANTGGPKTQPEVLAMLRQLLEDRFKLATHLEKRQVRVFHLVRARTNGPLGRDMKASAIDCDELQRARRANIESKVAEAQQTGATLTLEERTLWQPGDPCSERGRTIRGTTTLTLVGSTMAGLAKRLTLAAGGRVIDHTGLTGTYAVTLRYSRPDRSRTNLAVESLDDAPPLEAALRDQLGLKLEPHEGTTEILVITRIERPTEN